MPKTTRRTSAARSAPYPSPPSKQSSKPKPKPKPKSNKATDTKVEEPTDPSIAPHLLITLDGETDETVPVFDTCDEVRAKITSLFDNKTPNAAAKGKPYTKKALADQMGDITSQSLQRFRDHDGEMSGAEMKAYYKGYAPFKPPLPPAYPRNHIQPTTTHSYIFFEKLRLHTPIPKTPSRLSAEKSHPSGRDLHDPTRKRGGQQLHFWVGPGEDPNDFLTEEEKRQGLYFKEGRMPLVEEGGNKGRKGGGGGKGKKGGV